MAAIKTFRIFICKATKLYLRYEPNIETQDNSTMTTFRLPSGRAMTADTRMTQYPADKLQELLQGGIRHPQHLFVMRNKLPIKTC
jgi:hypothetical protein